MSRLELPGRANPELLRRAAELRRRMTPEERIVWQEVRGNRLGVHFRRQHPLPPYIVDFYCHQARLVVELDGSPHRHQQGYDICATAIWPASGFACSEWQIIQSATNCLQSFI